MTCVLCPVPYAAEDRTPRTSEVEGPEGTMLKITYYPYADDITVSSTGLDGWGLYQGILKWASSLKNEAGLSKTL